ncbi:MAG TPA: hypothetical protein PLB45_01940 [Bacilli bacterium]|jgi:nucleoside 2-deoxyribosyltransferase|nr:hypothetical protein [Bacilli bacterium]HPZ23634.1 hypothetical protein [Bacilli bacterium]HQC83621.1 hypothetical protein [Bacilli bacterium]
MEKPRLKIYFIHSAKIDANELIYLPVLRSNQLSHDELIFSESTKYAGKYYKDLIDRADVLVAELTNPDMGFNMELKYGIISKKPILALAQKKYGYEAKYGKILKNIIGYSTEEELRFYVEAFAKNYEGKVFSTKGESTLVLGVLK